MKLLNTVVILAALSSLSACTKKEEIAPEAVEQTAPEAAAPEAVEQAAPEAAPATPPSQ